MTEDEKKIMMWRNERRNGCMFPTQASYDDSHQKLMELKKRVLNKELCNIQVITTELVVLHGYGQQRATDLAIQWWREAYG